MADGGKKFKAQWSDLPPELLSPIAESLHLLELLSFRYVCKSWKSASSTASADHPVAARPWFLMYGGHNSECQLVNEGEKKYTLSIPELDGATCLASRQGWLLVFQEASGSMFFFCPFSRAIINLPKFTSSQLSDHIAAFSSPPTSQDCILGVVGRIDNAYWELSLLRRGSNEWTIHKYSNGIDGRVIRAIEGTVYHNEEKEFYFFDPADKLLTFPTESLSWKVYGILNSSSRASTSKLPFHLRQDHFQRENLKNKLGLAEDVSISTCGTYIESDCILVYGESITANALLLKILNPRAAK